MHPFPMCSNLGDEWFLCQIVKATESCLGSHEAWIYQHSSKFGPIRNFLNECTFNGFQIAYCCLWATSNTIGQVRYSQRKMCSPDCMFLALLTASYLKN